MLRQLALLPLTIIALLSVALGTRAETPSDELPPVPELKDIYIGDGPRFVMVHDANRGTMPFPVNELGPFTMYRVSLKTYRVASDTPLGPLPADAQLLEEQSFEMLDGHRALLTTTRQRGSFHPQVPLIGSDGKLVPNSSEPKLEPVVAESRIGVIPPHEVDPAPLGFLAPADGPGMRNGRDVQILKASDRLHCGDLDFEIYCPGANRVEICIEKSTGTRQLKYTEGQALPEVVTTSSEFAPHGWLASSLSGTDLGYLFDDGVAAPELGPAYRPKQ